MYRKNAPHPLLKTGLFYITTFAFSWSLWVPRALVENGLADLPNFVHFLAKHASFGAWGPFLGAVTVALLFDGIFGLKDLGKRLLQFRFSATWYGLSIVFLPMLIWLSGAIATSIFDQTLPATEAWQQPVNLPMAFIWIFFFGGPLQEEAGWRGTATHTLQKRYSALTTALYVGAVWGLWHLPLFYDLRSEIYYNQPFWGLFFSTTLLAVLLSILYNRTGGSLLAVMLMHTSFNWANYVFSSLQNEVAGLIYFVLLFTSVIGFVAYWGPKELGQNRQNKES